jgi:hypothetical protein
MLKECKKILTIYNVLDLVFIYYIIIIGSYLLYIYIYIYSYLIMIYKSF